MNQQHMLAAAQSKAAIAQFIGDRDMWRQALRQYFFAIGGRITY